MTDDEKNMLKQLLYKYQQEEKNKRHWFIWEKVEEECAEVLLAALGEGDLVAEKGDLFGCLLDYMHRRPHAFFMWMRRLKDRNAHPTPGQSEYIKMKKYDKLYGW